MADDKDEDRRLRKKRRGQHEREKAARNADLKREANAASKTNAAKQKLDQRICKLADDGYSLASIEKRLGVTPRRIKLALDAANRP